MADLLGGAGSASPAVTNGNGTSATRPTAAPAHTGSPSQGIRGPRVIMRERQEREARQRAEREQLERARAEREARELEEQQRRMAEQRAAAAGAGAAGAAGGNIPAQQSDVTAQQRRQQQAAADQARLAQASARVPQPMNQAQPQPQQQQQQPQQRPSRTTAPQPATSQQFAAGQPGAGPSAAGAPSGQTADPSGAGATRPRNSFPHAFERWEALSAHWEGLTSFWIRKLQQQASEIDRDPLSQQLARQVNDLSAAGANLFHAVVELQRLRASSERKFQRWFFETRAELERHQEVNAMLEAALEEERRGRADAIRDAVEHERANSKTKKRMGEMEKELRISKEEARRAWEELGRREQEERDRTLSLQQGLPTIVGGVQVVPMTQGVPSRHGSSRDPRSQRPAEEGYGSQYPAYPEASSPPPSVPSVPQPGPQSSAAAAGGPGVYPGRYQQQPGGEGSQVSGGGTSEGGYSEGEYAIDARGDFIRDSQGNKIPYRVGTPGDDRSDSGAEEEYETPTAQPQQYPPSSSHYASEPDYSGSGYGAPGWETVPRHHHPTRLSDVMEEDDERSRTSASQVSRG
ncbi:reticulocyte-binding 2 a protein [Pleurostoma richardsiae]|uniref:Reticulocyte-binding 2 a protein n=1 Tax=Pleurostoma richardsiae TaxID=41990 RepID=A0AA38RQ32_9PEZI|nr:reticulocyte-binding 2 a protein [Pleurostoma richardsiae]